jgi:hypothetical protein
VEPLQLLKENSALDLDNPAPSDNPQQILASSLDFSQQAQQNSSLLMSLQQHFE